VPFSRSASRTCSPAAAISAIKRARSGGVRKYSTTSGSTPAWRISASTLREVAQAGL